jgi:hypothetical protein
MFQVKRMESLDFQFATKLTNTMKWNMTPEDFEFNSSLEPEGCFIAFQGSERVGLATSISFGNLGWFGNLIVEEKYRSKGVGKLLVKHSIAYLQSKGVKTIGLYAYQNLNNFYSNLGFKKDETFSLLQAENLSYIKPESLPKIEKKQIKTIEVFDAGFFGGDRKKLLESIILEKGNLSYYFSENNHIVGYVAATVYESMAWVGPLICEADNIDVSISLIKAVLSKLTGKNVYLALAKKEKVLVKMLFSVGFKEDFSVSKMFLGEVKSRNCIYLAESLERG